MKDFKERRKARGYTQGELAKIFGVQVSTVSMWETGGSFPRADKLPKLAEILGCTIDDLLKDQLKEESA